jgi:Family of unknown function (DUF6375)
VRVWFGYGSEHSMNLVMIGRFTTTGDAAQIKQMIERLTDQVNSEIEAGRIEVGEPTDRYSDAMLQLLRDVELYDIRPAELEQFAYDVTVKVDGTSVVLSTDESDVSAFMKILLDRHARIEVFSAHHYPDWDASDRGE